MTDETVLAETPVDETIDPTTKIEAPEPLVAPKPEPEKTEEPKAETPEETPDETGEEPKKKIPGSQRLKRRLELIERDYLDAVRERDELKAEREKTLTPQQDGRPGIDREPRESDFANDYFAYQEAKTAWTVRQTIREENARLRQQEQTQHQTKAQQEWRAERLEIYEENKEAARERIPDFDKVVSSAADIIMKPEVVEELLASDKSALLQYHLAKNPEKARELNGMTGRELAREIGRLESRVHLPTPKKATEASAPPKEIKGGAAPTVDPQTGPDDMNAYVAWRRKQAS